MLLPHLILTLVVCPIRPALHPMPMLLILIPVTHILRPVRMSIGPSPMGLVLEPVPLIDITIGMHQLTVAISFVTAPDTLVT